MFSGEGSSDFKALRMMAGHLLLASVFRAADLIYWHFHLKLLGARLFTMPVALPIFQDTVSCRRPAPLAMLFCFLLKFPLRCAAFICLFCLSFPEPLPLSLLPSKLLFDMYAVKMHYRAKASWPSCLNTTFFLPPVTCLAY